MEDYVNSLEDFNDIRKVDNQNYPQSVTELKLYLKITKKITCLAQSTNTDHCYMGLDMVQKSNMATISDLRQINIILNKVRESKVSFSKNFVKVELQIVRIGDTSYKSDSISICSVIVPHR